MKNKIIITITLMLLFPLLYIENMSCYIALLNWLGVGDISVDLTYMPDMYKISPVFQEKFITILRYAFAIFLFILVSLLIKEWTLRAGPMLLVVLLLLSINNDEMPENWVLEKEESNKNKDWTEKFGKLVEINGEIAKVTRMYYVGLGSVVYIGVKKIPAKVIELLGSDEVLVHVKFKKGGGSEPRSVQIGDYVVITTESDHSKYDASSPLINPYQIPTHTNEYPYEFPEAWVWLKRQARTGLKQMVNLRKVDLPHDEVNMGRVRKSDMEIFRALVKNKESTRRYYNKRFLPYASDKARKMIEAKERDYRDVEIEIAYTLIKRFRENSRTTALNGDFELEDVETGFLEKDRVDYNRLNGLKQIPTRIVARLKGKALRLKRIRLQGVKKHGSEGRKFRKREIRDRKFYGTDINFRIKDPIPYAPETTDYRRGYIDVDPEKDRMSRGDDTHTYYDTGFYRYKNKYAYYFTQALRPFGYICTRIG